MEQEAEQEAEQEEEGKTEAKVGGGGGGGEGSWTPEKVAEAAKAVLGDDRQLQIRYAVNNGRFRERDHLLRENFSRENKKIKSGVSGSCSVVGENNSPKTKNRSATACPLLPIAHPCRVCSCCKKDGRHSSLLHTCSMLHKHTFACMYALTTKCV